MHPRLTVGLVVTVIAAACATHPGGRPSPRMMDRLDDEIQQGLAQRAIRPQFEQYQRYACGRLDASLGTNTWSDKTGNCRLSWYDSLLRNQLAAPREVERFSHELHAALRNERGGLARAVALAAQKLDWPVERARRSADLPDVLERCRHSYDAAWAPLTTDERRDLQDHLYEVTTKQIEGHSHSFRDQAMGRRLCDLLEKLNRRALCEAANALLPLTNREFLKSLAAWPAKLVTVPVPGVTGDIRDWVSTPAGSILVGGPGNNTYDLEALTNVAVVIDIGGNDRYREGTAGFQRPVLIIIDLAGDDHYVGEQPGIQGGAVGGISLLIDRAGNDRYEAQDIAQGACVAGVGILIDEAGNDTYRGLRRNQGSAMGGLALLIDRAGNDSYHSALYAQGFGGPLGLGVLDDLGGDDHYYAGGKWKDGYDDTPGYDGWSQGVGAGPRKIANGGIGVLLDGGGDDVYEADYFSHGGGYWFAVGIARDFGGHDQRLGATRLAYDGAERAEKRFLRWGVGWQAHYGLGFVIDDAGNDDYGGDIVGLGFSWDVGLAALLDFGGNDQYRLTYGGQGQQAAFAILFDGGGDDTYGGTDYGGAPAAIAYHPMPDCGGNFAFAINLGGTNTYGGKPPEAVVLERGSPGGFLINRPGRSMAITTPTQTRRLTPPTPAGAMPD